MSRVSVSGGSGSPPYAAFEQGFADVYAPTGMVAQNFSRLTTFVNTVSVTTSGTMRMWPIYLPAGIIVSAINFIAGGQVQTASTHLWGALYNPSFALLSQSADNTNGTPLTANTKHTFTLSAAQTITSSGKYYIGFLGTVSSGNMNTFSGVSVGLSAVSGEDPDIAFDADAGLTTTAPATATPGTVSNAQPWFWLT